LKSTSPIQTLDIRILNETSTMKTRYEAPRSNLRGIKAEFAEANPPSLFELRRIAAPFIPAAPLEGISAPLRQVAGYSGEGE
jgi:hypothetical protein